jgi:hypothetical protein
LMAEAGRRFAEPGWPRHCARNPTFRSRGPVPCNTGPARRIRPLCPDGPTFARSHISTSRCPGTSSRC